MVPSEYVGAIIGRKGQTIRNITTRCKARSVLLTEAVNKYNDGCNSYTLKAYVTVVCSTCTFPSNIFLLTREEKAIDVRILDAYRLKLEGISCWPQ